MLHKTGGTSAWDAGAFSTQSINSGDGGGYVSVVADATNAAREFGLGDDDGSSNFDHINYGIYLKTDGRIEIRENGVMMGGGEVGSYAAGDVLKVMVQGTTVKYYNNDNLLYTSTTPASYPLYLDTSLYTQGGNFEDALLCAGSDCLSSPTAPPYTDYYSFGGKLVGMRRANYTTSGSNGQFRIVGDQLGSTTIIVDTASPPNVVQRQYSKPYGETAMQYTASSSGGASLTNVGYTAQRTDETSTGLIFYNARMYDPALSFFASADNIPPNANDPATRNRYSYTSYNPVRYNDPSGHCADNYCGKSGAAEQQSRDTCYTYDCETAKFKLYGIVFDDIGAFSLAQLEAIAQSILDLRDKAGWNIDEFRKAMDTTNDPLTIANNNDLLADPKQCDGLCPHTYLKGGELAAGATFDQGKRITLNLAGIDSIANAKGVSALDVLKRTFVHELAHVMDQTHGFRYSTDLAVGLAGVGSCKSCLGNNNGFANDASIDAIKNAYGVQGAGWNAQEDWAESVSGMVYGGKQEDYQGIFADWNQKYPGRASYVQSSFNDFK